MTTAETTLEPPDLAFRRPWAAAIDRAIGAVVGAAAAFLVIVEIVILATGVFTRYVIREPLDWTDELATILLLWLAMLGAVVAYRRGEHIRLQVVLRRSSPRRRALLETIGSVVTAIFVLELLPASVTFFKLELTDPSPALGIPRSDVVLAVIVGLVLILVLALLRLSEGDPKIVAAAVAGAVALSALAFFGRGAFVVLGNGNLVIFFVLLLGACVAIGIPIAFAFGVGTLSYLAITTTVPLSTVVERMNEGVSNIVLLAVPLFIFLGLLMDTAGIARRLVEALASLVGHVRGGLSIELVAAMYLVSGVSGSKIADMAAVAGLLLPLLIRYFVVAGIATATEVSVVGIFYTVLVGVSVYREFDWKRMYPILLDTVALSGAILLIIATATAMGWALTQSGFAQQLAAMLAAAPGGTVGIMLVSIVLFMILGSVLEGIPAMVLFAPLLFPVAKAAGINEVHYAIAAVLAMGIGLFAPPIGVGFFSASAIGKANPEAVVKPIVPYLAALLISLLLIAFIPWISLGFLPKPGGP